MTFQTMSVQRFVVKTIILGIGSLLVSTILSIVPLMSLDSGISLATLILSSLAMGVVAMVVVTLTYVFTTLTLTIIAYSEGEIPDVKNEQ